MSTPVSLRERLENTDIRGSGQRASGIDNRAYQKLKQRLHAAHGTPTPRSTRNRRSCSAPAP